MMLLSEVLWETLLEEFRWPRAAVERVAYIDGVVHDDVKIATTVTLPAAAMHATYFTVSADAMSQAGQHFRPYGIERLAQVHTHPGSDVRHSPFDDENAYSQLDGAISIVLPHHARRHPAPKECGVHIRDSAGWRRLASSEIERAIIMLPGLLDFRRYK